MIEHIGHKNSRKNYKKPEQKYANSVINVRLYCQHRGCNTYVKGKLGYNGSFITEDGDFADLRNQEFTCTKHELKSK
jgi:hypothetical protein